MGNVGRIFCVAFPFILTVASLVALLIAGLGGVGDKNMFIFEVNTTSLSISPDNLSKLFSRDPGETFHSSKLLGSSGSSTPSSSGSNITAADLGLANLYDIGLWGYCSTPQSGGRTCQPTEWNWAQKQLVDGSDGIKSLSTVSGQNVTLPKSIVDAVELFATLTHWTEIVFIVGYAALALELLVGMFSSCSRIISCVTFLVGFVASAAVVGAAGLSTAMAAVVVGAVEGTAKFYGVRASFHTPFLAVVWIAAACAVGAGLFWMFTICCCAPEHRESRRRRHGKRAEGDEAGEKLMPVGAYHPLQDPEAVANNGGLYNNAPQYGAPRYPSGGRSDLAYEPYSHARV